MQKVRMFDCETALRSSFITEETRRESYEKVNKEKMHLLILEQLSHFDMTAREIATSLYQQGKVLERQDSRFSQD